VRVGGTTQRYHILTFLLHTSYYFTLQGRQNVSERAHIASFIWRWPIVNGDRQDVSCSWDLPSLNRISYHYLDDVEFVPVTGVVFTLNIPAPEVSMARRSGCIRQLYLWHITRVRIFFSDASFSLFAFVFSEKQHGRRSTDANDTAQARTPTNPFHLPSIVQLGQGRQGFVLRPEGNAASLPFQIPRTQPEAKVRFVPGGIRFPSIHIFLTPGARFASFCIPFPMIAGPDLLSLTSPPKLAEAVRSVARCCRSSRRRTYYSSLSPGCSLQLR
jgi:hypothetical protein